MVFYNFKQPQALQRVTDRQTAGCWALLPPSIALRGET